MKILWQFIVLLLLLLYKQVKKKINKEWGGKCNSTNGANCNGEKTVSRQMEINEDFTACNHNKFV